MTDSKKRIIIKNEAARLVYGEVYVPMRLDTDSEFMTAEEIMKAAHRFMENNQNDNVDTEHQFEGAGDVVVESYIAKMNDPDGYLPGSWVAGGYIKDDKRWEKVLKGEINGWSMAGRAQKRKCEVSVSAVEEMWLKTEKSTAENVEPHEHEIVLKFNEDGTVVPSKTSEVGGHSHDVWKTTATQDTEGHAHRFDISWDEESENVKKTEKVVEATELYDVEPKWLSLVRHAAVRRGFKVVKSDTTEEMEEKSVDIVEDLVEEVEKMDKIVHAIICRKDVELEKLDFDWFDEKKIIDTFPMKKADKHVLVPRKEFIENSIEVVTTDKAGVKLVVGILKGEDEMTRDEIVTLIGETLDARLADVKKDDSEIAEIKSMLSELAESLRAKQAGEVVEQVEEAETMKDDLVKPVEEEKPEQSNELAEIKAMLAQLKESNAQLTEKTDKIMEKTTSYPGALERDESNHLKKSDEPESFWAGRLFRRDNPKIQAVLNS